MAPYRPKKILGLFEFSILVFRQQAHFNQGGRRTDAMDIFPDPIQSVQIAKSALAVFDIGFDDISAVAHFFMSLVPFHHFLGNEIGSSFSCDVVPEPCRSLLIDCTITPHEPAFQ